MCDTRPQARAWSIAAGIAIGWVLHELWGRTKASREAEAMRRLSEREAAVSAALAKGEVDGDAVVSCTRGDGRTFGISRSDTALVLIDMQVDFLHPCGRLGQHYDASRHEALGRTQERVLQLLQAARRSGLTIAHSRSHRYGALVRRDLLEGQQPGAAAIGDAATPQHFGAVDTGYELLPQLRALPGEIVVDKWTFGAFASTDLEAQLRARGVRKVWHAHQPAMFTRLHSSSAGTHSPVTCACARRDADGLGSGSRLDADPPRRHPHQRVRLRDRGAGVRPPVSRLPRRGRLGRLLA